MKIKNILAVACVASLASATCMAAQTNSNANSSTVKLQHLEKQMVALQGQVKQMEQEHKYTSKKKTSSSQSGVASRVSSKKQSTSSKLAFLHSQNYVVIEPFTSQPTYYSGGKLVVNAVGINEDAKLLYRRLLNEKPFLDAGIEKAKKPRLVLSGKVEGLASYNNPYAGRYSSDIDLYGAELDVFAEVSPWINGFMALAYDSNPATNNVAMVGSNRRISNSRIYLDSGFLTIGNFSKSGLYSSIGQFTVPFGRFGSNMIATPLTGSIGETDGRAITLNYIANPETHVVTPYVHTFVFKGDTKYGSHNNIVKNYGIDVGSWMGGDNVNGGLGASYISNLADGKYIQNNGGGAGFMGFEQTSGARGSSEMITHRIGGLDVHGNFNWGAYSFLAEYVTALQSYSRADLTYNGHGARPNALNIEGAYTFTAFNMPSSVALGYGLSRQALAYNIPHQRYVASWSLTFLRNTVLTLEARHDINYGKGDTATGNAGGGTMASAVTVNQLGKIDNALTARVGVYF